MPKFGSSRGYDITEDLSSGFMSGLEGALLRKEKKKDRDEAEEQRISRFLEERKLLGYDDLTGRVPKGTMQSISGEQQEEYDPEGYERVVDIYDKKLGKTLSPYELRKRDAELGALEQKGKDVPFFYIDKSGIPRQVELPEGFTAKGAKVATAKSDIGAQNLAQKEKEFEYKQGQDTIKTEAKQVKSQREADLLLENTADMVNSIQFLEDNIKYFGVTGDIPSLTPGQGKLWDAHFNKVLAAKVLNVMTKLKAASQTGATGFGQLNRSELKILQDAATELKKGLKEEDAARVLGDMKEKLMKVLEGADSGQEQQIDNDPLGLFE